jgi:hypothetical protein
MMTLLEAQNEVEGVTYVKPALKVKAIPAM